MDKWLLNNNVVKGIALFIAVSLWFVVHYDTNHTSATSPAPAIRDQKINNVKIVPKYDANRYYVRSIDPQEVDVTLHGKDSDLKSVNVSNFRVEMDLGSYASGTHTVALRPIVNTNKISADVNPPYVTVVIEDLEIKQVPVEVNITGTPDAGFKAGVPIIKPGRVNVTAPKSVLDQIAAVRGEISVDKAAGNVAKQVKLTAYDAKGKALEGSINPQLVDVEVPVTSPFKKMPLQVKLVGQPPAGFGVVSVTQSTEQIIVHGPQDILDKMDFYDGLQIDLTGLKETRKVTLDVPLQPKVLQVEPGKVDVTITIGPSVTRKFDSIPLALTGAENGVTAKLLKPENGTISVEVEGAPNLVNQLKPQDIQAAVDISNVPPGQQVLPVNVNLPVFIKKVSPDEKVTVEITAKAVPSPSPSPSPSASPSATATPAAGALKESQITQ